MPNRFTARHDPPIESVLTRAIILGDRKGGERLWKVEHQFTEEAAAPDASYGLLVIGVNSMVYHHSTSESDEGLVSATCSIPGTPFIFVCDAAAVQAKPHGQHIRDNYLATMRRQGLEICRTCDGRGHFGIMPTGRIPCMACRGEGFMPIMTQERPVPQPQSPTAVPRPKMTLTQYRKIEKVQDETGLDNVQARQALEDADWDVEKALENIDRGAR